MPVALMVSISQADDEGMPLIFASGENERYMSGKSNPWTVISITMPIPS